MPGSKRLLLLSAGSTQSLQAMTESYQTYLAEHPERLDSVAFNLANRRERLKHRTVCMTDSTGAIQPITPLASKAKDRTGVAFVFTGQGVHWVRMGRELMHNQPLFRDTIREVDDVLNSLEYATSWTVEEILLTCEDSNILGRPQIAHPVCTAMQVALVKLFAAWGVEPAAAIGHSSGEAAAAYAAGALSMRDAVITAFYRGYACEQLQKVGAMAVVGLSAAEAKNYLKPGTVVACENSPKNVTLSGDVEPLDDVLVAITQDYPDLFIRKLEAKQGYHSRKWRVPWPQIGLNTNTLRPYAPYRLPLSRFTW